MKKRVFVKQGDYVPEFRKNQEGSKVILREFNYASSSIKDLNNIDWDNILAL